MTFTPSNKFSSVALMSLALSFNASAMLSQQEAQKMTCQQEVLPELDPPTETKVFLGGTKIVEDRYKEVIIRKTTVVKKVDIDKHWTDGDEHTEPGMHQKLPPCEKLEEFWEKGDGLSRKMTSRIEENVQNGDQVTNVHCDHKGHTYEVITTVTSEQIEKTNHTRNISDIPGEAAPTTQTGQTGQTAQPAQEAGPVQAHQSTQVGQSAPSTKAKYRVSAAASRFQHSN